MFELTNNKHTAEGLLVEINGEDPYFHGPSHDYPANKPLWLNIRLKSDRGGTAQIFYFTHIASESNSIRFQVPAGIWYEAKLPVPALGKGCILRIDPPGAKGFCLINKIWFEDRIFYDPPPWPKPALFSESQNDLIFRSGSITFRHHPSLPCNFSVLVDGYPMAQSLSDPMIGYIKDMKPRWFLLSNQSKTTTKADNKQLLIDTLSTDPDGGVWKFTEKYSFAQSNYIHCEFHISVDQDRQILFLPVCSLISGMNTFGTNKNQGILAGVEYLENEPSSSEADLIGPAAQRLVPNNSKITFPLMAIQQSERYVGLIWERHADLSAIFDSPDRQFKSGGHLMGLLCPGSDGANREEGRLLPYWPKNVSAGQILAFKAQIIGGRGSSVVPPVQQYVQLKGVPPLPIALTNSQAFLELMAEGWLDSSIRDENRYRHATPGFNSLPAADAACWMQWLAGNIKDPGLTSRLNENAIQAIRQVTPNTINQAQVGHVRFPVPALVFGKTAENLMAAENHGKGLLGRFSPDGTVKYTARPGVVDYGKTHWVRHANGLTASVLSMLMDDALFTGNPILVKESLRLLGLLNQYRSTVPRGAQTWEIPLHTPDILASAYLVRAYVRGYQLTGNKTYLEEARYWAWTGVPFVYLVSPVNQPVGVYSTIAVLGATGWVAPVWIGLPVQWCGLVYADALQELAEYDTSGPWKTIAEGIAASGIQQTYPSADRNYRGLLPDSYSLESQNRNGPNINPATLLAPAHKIFPITPIYQSRVLHGRGLFVHAPGAIELISEDSDTISLNIKAWPQNRVTLVINGFVHPPQIRLNNESIQLISPHSFDAAKGVIILSICGSTRLDIAYPRTK